MMWGDTSGTCDLRSQPVIADLNFGDRKQLDWPRFAAPRPGPALPLRTKTGFFDERRMT